MSLFGRWLSKNLWIQLEYFIMFLTLSALDYRLNPVLRKACKADIPKFCHGILTKAKEDSELEGQVISCLKLRYADQVDWPRLSTEVCSWSRLYSWQWFSKKASALSYCPRTFCIPSQVRGQVKSWSCLIAWHVLPLSHVAPLFRLRRPDPDYYSGVCSRLPTRSSAPAALLRWGRIGVWSWLWTELVREVFIGEKFFTPFPWALTPGLVEGPSFRLSMVQVPGSL